MSSTVKQLTPAPLEGPTPYEIALQTISPKSILKEQSEASVITVLTGMISRLVRLYQIPGFVKGQDVELADWIYEKYKWEPFQVIYNVLKSPPELYDENGAIERNWRLTPDTVMKWMETALDNQAIKLSCEAQSSQAPSKPIDEEDLKKYYKQIADRNAEAFNQKQKSIDLRKIRFGPQNKYWVWTETKTQCDALELYAIDEAYAKKIFKESFKVEPVKITHIQRSVTVDSPLR